MKKTRREFLTSISATVAVGAVAQASGYRLEDDPLGVRGDFPVVDEGIYLDGSAITFGTNVQELLLR